MHKQNQCTILFPVMAEMKLSPIEYIVLDLIECVSYANGYSFVTFHRESMGKKLGITKMGLIKIVHRLIRRGLVEVNDRKQLMPCLQFVKLKKRYSSQVDNLI